MSGEKDIVRTMWVGDVEPWMDEAYIFHTFSVVGKVTNIKLLRGASTSSGEKRGYAFVEFSEAEDVERLMERLNGQRFMSADGRYFRLGWASYGVTEGYAKPEAGSKYYSVWVGNLDASVREVHLQKLFAQKYASVTCAKVIVDSSTMLSKGFGFVRFRNQEEASAAITEMQGVMLGSKALRVKEAVGRHSNHHHGQEAGTPSNSQAPQTQQQTSWSPAAPPPPLAVVGYTLYIGGVEVATQQDAARLIECCMAFGAVYRVKPVEAGLLVEFQDLASAQRAQQYLWGSLQLPSQLVESSAMDLAPDFADGGFRQGPVITNMTMMQAETELQVQQAQPEPSLEQFQIFLQDPRFVRAFENLLGRGATTPSAPAGMKWSWLLDDKPELFGKSAEDAVRLANEDFCRYSRSTRTSAFLSDDVSMLA
eukprot:TRINITY_DN12098_c0_g1_i1.p1 TRINITY_DN12098_c0_g1~~TRINITY_DN12098_c0_g1_i1.p1  ORF type:complete len:423 (+),score=95.64 TRINITY_DN12098_c0_g1_i1:340-1608(+)